MEIIWKISTTYILGLHGLKVRNITAMRLAQALQRIKLCNTVVVDWDFVYLWCCGDNINQGCPKDFKFFFYPWRTKNFTFSKTLHRYLANRGLKIPAWIECEILYFSDINYQKSWIKWQFFCISFYVTITIIIPEVKTFISQDSNFNILKLQSYAISTNVSALQKYRRGTQVKLVLHFGEELEFLSVRKGKMYTDL